MCEQKDSHILVSISVGYKDDNYHVGMYMVFVGVL